MTLVRAADFPLAELARLFTAGYEGYFVPVQVDEAAMRSMVESFDLDLGRSFVALDGDTPVAVANLGVRGERTWLGGVGVAPAHRRRGFGEQLTVALIEQAREAGAREMVLEVITENTPAIALYEKLGYAHARELDVLSLPAEPGEATATAIPLAEAAREHDPPWQRAKETIAKLEAVEAVAAGAACAIFRVAGERVSLLQASGDITPLLPALRARGALSAVNYPSGGAVSAAIQAAGGTVMLRQYEMTLSL